MPYTLQPFTSLYLVLLLLLSDHQCPYRQEDTAVLIELNRISSIIVLQLGAKSLMNALSYLDCNFFCYGLKPFQFAYKGDVDLYIACLVHVSMLLCGFRSD